MRPDCETYEGTEPWRPPETLSSGGEAAGASPELATEGLQICDRTDVFSFGLVLWETLTGDVPHAAALPRGDAAYRDALGTRPALPPLPAEYRLLEQVFRCCTQRVSTARPSATEVEQWLSPHAMLFWPADGASEAASEAAGSSSWERGGVPPCDL
mgnify:CR=1 FL=1